MARAKKNAASHLNMQILLIAAIAALLQNMARKLYIFVQFREDICCAKSYAHAHILLHACNKIMTRLYMHFYDRPSAIDLLSPVRLLRNFVANKFFKISTIFYQSRCRLHDSFFAANCIANMHQLSSTLHQKQKQNRFIRTHSSPYKLIQKSIKIQIS